MSYRVKTKNQADCWLLETRYVNLSIETERIKFLEFRIGKIFKALILDDPHSLFICLEDLEVD